MERQELVIFDQEPMDSPTNQERSEQSLSKGRYLVMWVSVEKSSGQDSKVQRS